MSENDTITFEESNKRALKIVTHLRANGFVAYYVGGWVRDLLLKQKSTDIDIATNARPEDVMRLFKKTIPVGMQFGVVLVLEGSVHYEVATFRSDGQYLDGRHPTTVHFSSPEEDAARRDFTINGMFWDPVEKKVIDFVGGEEDLKKGIIRAIGDPYARFAEDKLRMLRAIRFAARFDFPIEETTYTAVTKLAAEIEVVSQERIRDELVKMLTGPAPAKSIRLLDETGLLEAILPEITAMKGIEQPPEFHPEGDVFVHTMLMLEKIKNADLILALAILFHDVGKPKTMRTTDRIRFSCHDALGARMTENIMRRLRFSNKEIEQVVQCVQNHMNIMHVQKMREGKLKRFIASETFNAELMLHKIDCESSHGMLDNYEFLVAKQEEFAKEDLKPKPLLTGQDLIDLGLAPGPHFKDILAEALDLQLEGKLTSKEDAIQWFKNSR
ncbi:MAG: CCA tRNA nucleotidyltransferase [Candidatus Omnitrophica bacterium]|nr:CCA tRNA nucleotidyltransferase [Candidatus Omnitrophota bacterium]